MDIEQLTKAQTVLLTLLVSFVTSIATGIVTVSLMEQGVTPVTQTINRVVERVVQQPAEPVVVTEEKMVVIREADLIAAAVKKNINSTAAVFSVAMVPIVATEATTTATTSDQVASVVLAQDSNDATDVPATTEQTTFVARGVFIQKGVLVTDASGIKEGDSYKVVLNDGSLTQGSLATVSGGLAVLTLDDALGTPVTFGDTSGITRGKTVIALSGMTRVRIITAVVADFVASESGVDAIETDAGAPSLGAVLVDTDGNVIGMSTSASRSKSSTWFEGAETLKSIKL